MIRAITARPVSLRTFSEGSICNVAPAWYVEKVADELVADGIATRDGDFLAITPAGLADFNKPPSVAVPRIWCAASIPSNDPYRTPNWNVRDGGNEHEKYRSRGV